MTTTIIIIAAIILLIFIFRKKNSADSTMRSVANLDDFTLSENEKKTANILKQTVAVLEEDPNAKFHPQMNYKGAMDEIAVEIFKCGMWRLNDKNLANKYFRNPGYIEINKQKFIDDFEKKINENFFVNHTTEMFERYILQWVLKFKNDTKQIDTFLR